MRRYSKLVTVIANQNFATCIETSRNKMLGAPIADPENSEAGEGAHGPLPLPGFVWMGILTFGFPVVPLVYIIIAGTFLNLSDKSISFQCSCPLFKLGGSFSAVFPVDWSRCLKCLHMYNTGIDIYSISFLEMKTRSQGLKTHPQKLIYDNKSTFYDVLKTKQLQLQ